MDELGGAGVPLDSAVFGAYRPPVDRIGQLPPADYLYPGAAPGAPTVPFLVRPPWPAMRASLGLL
jgi:hypothetical protein